MRTPAVSETDAGLGTVVSYCPIASAFGTRVLWDGGNAIDAAVVTGLALAATYPQAGNLGGGGFMMISTPKGGVHFLDYRETAPRNLNPKSFVDDTGARSTRSVRGAAPVGVPGTVAGLAAALERFGTWSWDQVIEPAIELAETGQWLTTRQAAFLDKYIPDLAAHPSTLRSFLGDRTKIKPGTLFRQSELGRALRILAHNGARDFYEGTLASLVVDEVRRGGGVLDEQDLAAYQPKWREPVRRRIWGKEAFLPPLPSSGGMVAAIATGLVIAEGIASLPAASLDRYLLLARAFRIAFAVRHKLAGDPDFMDHYELAEIAELLSQDFRPGHLAEYEGLLLGRPFEVPDAQSSNTTHFCVIDREGNAVSNTYSLNTLFGSKLAVSGAGFLLNNCLDDFRIGGDAPNWYGIVDGVRNQMLPLRKPVGSMTPTIVRNAEGEVELLLGGSGGPMIATLVTQILISVLLDGHGLTDAMMQPRIHHQYLKPELYIERTISEEMAVKLEVLGDPVVRRPRLGIGAAIQRHLPGKEVSGALDPRFGQYHEI